MSLKSVSATLAAQDLLGRLEAGHGPLRIQISGSYGVSVVCLPAGELRTGARDHQVGVVGSVPVFMMTNEARYWEGADVVIDVIKGAAVSFSLEGPEGVHFTLRKRSDPSHMDWTGQGLDLRSQKG